MKLSDFIRSHMDSILGAWEQFANEIPSAHHLDTAALRDHATGILSTIATDLDQPQSPHEQTEKSKGRAPRSAKETPAELHGAVRVLEGFNVNEAVSEFRALRASVLRLWSESNPTPSSISSDELIRFNEAIDQALTESLARYSTDIRLFDALLSSSPDLHYLLDAHGNYIYVNQAFAQLYGKHVRDIVGKNFFDLGVFVATELQQQLQQVIETKATYRGEMTHARGSGQAVTYEYLFVPVTDDESKVEAVAGTARDITERKAAEEKIRRSATYDALTGLPNRSLFRDRLEWEVKRSERSGVPMALLFIDLDTFKQVNDQLGHAAGDQLLQQAAQRIRSCVRATDTVARLGGDEFTVILAEFNQIPHIENVAREILEELARPFLVMQKEVHISGSIGITLFPQDATTPDDLIRNADQAMYMAKNAGRNRCSFFKIGMRESALARLNMIDELRRALPQQQFVVYFQPIVDLADERIVKAEALLRWHHPHSGLMLPEAFIGLAEESGLVGDIDAWVLSEALARARQWCGLLGMPFQISVNKSPVEFMAKAPMKYWEAHLAALELACHCISVEITEGVLLSDSPNVTEKLERLHNAGVELAIDDFGTGCASVAYLKKFDVDYLKIDQSFVHDVETNNESRTIVEAIIVMAHKLGLKVIAEGVETVEQRDWLKGAKCDYAQGYLFSKPVPTQDFERLLHKGKVH